MNEYRFEIQATVNFSIRADTEAEATIDARAVVNDHCHGLHVPLATALHEDLAMQVYMDETTPLTCSDRWRVRGPLGVAISPPKGPSNE